MQPVAMGQVFLIRHAATAMAGTLCGQSDPDLDAVGAAQLCALQAHLAPASIDRILRSDLRRASRCARALATQHDAPVSLHPAWREIHFGAWEGLTWPEIEHRFPDDAHRWLSGIPHGTPAQGEPYADLRNRVLRQARQCLNEAQCGTLAHATHRGVLQLLLQSLCALPAAAAWRMTSECATVLVCEAAYGTNPRFTVCAQWSAR
jgi:broad specificity phosphatase PhoE